MPSRLYLIFRYLVLGTVALLVTSQSGPSSWTTTPFSPPALPLAVRSPYLNTWLPQGFGPTQFDVHTWPNLWNIDGTVTSWYASVVVDGLAYRLIGTAPIPNVSEANQTAIEFTPTQTSVQLTAGPMQMNVSFLSPIEPTDLVRQSLPFTYLSISASSTDGNSHSLQMYSDISGEFIAGDTSQIAQWTADDSGDYVVLSMQLQTQKPFSETNSFAQDATEYYSFKKISGTTTTWAIAEDTINRGNAANRSLSLGNKTDPTPRAVSTFGNNQPVLGIAVDWGEVQSTPEPAVWAIGVVRSPSIQYKTASGSIEERYPYFLSTYNDTSTAAKAFLDDFSRAAAIAATLDAQLAAAGQQISLAYVHLLSLSARQAMGCMDITLSQTGDGEWNMSDVKIFMKNMGGAGSDSTGTSMSVNTVDTLYAAFPIFMYLNPELGGYLLSPLLEYQDSAAYTLSYAAKNIGSAYPNATADDINDGHDYGVEETANMLIMTLAYSQASGNGTFLSSHYAMLRRWAEFLGNNSLTPTNQRSADFSPFSALSNDNQTNTALKGIIGIAAMAKISEIMGASDDQKSFNDTATSFISEWQNEALAPDQSHVNFFYGLSLTSGLIYNVYADKMLHLGLVSDAVYEALTEYYQTIPSQNKYGVPLSNTQPHNSSTNWMMFAASTVTSSETRDLLISQVHDYVTSNSLSPGNFYPLITNYDPTSGGIINMNGNGANSPAQGAMFALLALNTTVMPINTTANGNNVPPTNGSPGGISSKSNKPRIGVIVGGIVAGVVVACVIGCAVVLWRRRVRRDHPHDARVDPMDTTSTVQTGTLATTLYTGSLEGKGPSQPSNLSSQATPSSLQVSKSRMPHAYVAVSTMPPVRKSDPHINPPEPSGSTTTRVDGDNHEPALENERTDRRDSRQLAPPVDDNLRAEVENLRQVIERMRENGMDEEAPPSYSDPGLP